MATWSITGPQEKIVAAPFPTLKQYMKQRRWRANNTVVGTPLSSIKAAARTVSVVARSQPDAETNTNVNI
jgi:hypothetical protein